MAAQLAGSVLNWHLNVLLPAVALILGLTGGAATGAWLAHAKARANARADAKHQMRLAFTRAARDVRGYRENAYGLVPASGPAKALHIAELMLDWRSRDGNWLTPPTGDPARWMLHPPGAPRAARHRKPEVDTSQISLAEFTHRRYNP